MNAKNYISDAIKKFGPNFLVQKSQDTIMRESDRLFKDIAYGSVAPNEYVNYLTSDLLLVPCIAAANERYQRNRLYYEGLRLLMITQPPTDQISLTQMNSYIAELEQKLQAYTFIIQAFNKVKDTRTVEPLLILTNQIKEFKAVL
jgi:hypothetical protein